MFEAGGKKINDRRPFHVSADRYRTWVETFCSGDDPLFFAVVPKFTGTAAGIASYLRIKPESGSIEVGNIHFSPSLQAAYQQWLRAENFDSEGRQLQSLSELTAPILHRRR